MSGTHAHDIASYLNNLEEWLPRLVNKHTVSGVLQEEALKAEFAGAADVIIQDAGNDRQYARERINEMLKNAGLTAR